jgi:serine/threonine protein phosphatase PrpC
MQFEDRFGLRASLAIVYAQSGKRAEAQKILDEFIIQSRQRFVSETDVAALYAYLGERDQAMEWLEKGYEERSGAMILLKSDPMWDPLSSDQRFQALIRKIGFPE